MQVVHRVRSELDGVWPTRFNYHQCLFAVLWAVSAMSDLLS